MQATTPFAQMLTTPDPIIAQVRRQLARQYANVPDVAPTELDQIADRTVRDLWTSRVKTFVAILALRQAHEVLQARTSATHESLVRRTSRS